MCYGKIPGSHHVRMFTVLIETRLIKRKHDKKIGDRCGNIEPTVVENTVFTLEEKPIGFYLKTIPTRLNKLIQIANKELLSTNVPKSVMKRSSGLQNKKNAVLQFSTIIGSCPQKALFRRLYPTISSVHGKETAKPFIRAMYLACLEAEKIIAEYLPEQFEKQRKLIEQNVSPKWQFGNLFTSSISNYNISAPYHQDHANIKGTVNVIITKRFDANGGNLNVPDYDLTVEQADSSLLVYPAWRNMHGVTPIHPKSSSGYRNSFIFYPLTGFSERTN